MSIVYGNGIGDTLGNVLSTCKPLYTSGNVWYVNGTIGVDAASPAGQNREKPLDTLLQAVTNAADNDIIELLAGHEETITVPLAIAKRLTIIGGGLSGGLPTVRLIAGVNNPISISGNNVELRNISFPQSVVAVSGVRISVAGSQFRMIGCYVECGALDTNTALSLSSGSDQARIVNTTFISTATSVTAQPTLGINIPSAITDLELDGLVLSGGSVGFSNYRAFVATGIITRLRATNVSLLLGADFQMATASTGYINPQITQGGSRLDW